jgi:hypothetical protein
MSSHESKVSEHEYEITFTLAAGYDEDDALDLYEEIERDRRVAGVAMLSMRAEPVRSRSGGRES